MKSPAGKSKVSTDSVIRDIFEPVYKAGLLTQDPRTEVATVFFREKKPTPSRKRILCWVGLSGILFFSAHLILTGLEQMSLSRQAADFLRTKESEAQILEKQLAERKKKESYLRSILRKNDEEIRTLETHLQWIEKQAQGGQKITTALTQLAVSSPQGIWLQEFSVEEERMYLKGNSVRPGIVTRFLAKLNQSDTFKNAKVLTLTPPSGARPSFYSFEVASDVLS